MGGLISEGPKEQHFGYIQIWTGLTAIDRENINLVEFLNRDNKF